MQVWHAVKCIFISASCHAGLLKPRCKRFIRWESADRWRKWLRPAQPATLPVHAGANAAAARRMKNILFEWATIGSSSVNQANVCLHSLISAAPTRTAMTNCDWVDVTLAPACGVVAQVSSYSRDNCCYLFFKFYLEKLQQHWMDSTAWTRH